MSETRYRGPIHTITKVLRADAKFLGADDLRDKVDRCLIITEVVDLKKEQIAGKTVDRKFALALRWPDGTPCKKKLIINTTRKDMLIQLYGEEHTDQWEGKPIWVGFGTTRRGKETVGCVVIRNRKDVAKTAQKEFVTEQISDDHPTITSDPSQEGIVPGDAAE